MDLDNSIRNAIYLYNKKCKKTTEGRGKKKVVYTKVYKNIKIKSSLITNIKRLILRKSTKQIREWHISKKNINLL